MAMLARGIDHGVSVRDVAVRQHTFELRPRDREHDGR
jgi:hypothetical protein